ncbi:hypothetical protein ACO2Q1_01465 [Brevundimonas sp. VNH65]|uniref:hypothetical protein n=1 Tax=Brevundimonas sp. VNH65 TaxID=3400917 RepID=UPI003BFF54ED
MSKSYNGGSALGFGGKGSLEFPPKLGRAPSEFRGRAHIEAQILAETKLIYSIVATPDDWASRDAMSRYLQKVMADGRPDDSQRAERILALWHRLDQL